MISEGKFYEEHLNRLSILFVMFGYIELELRKRIVLTLSNLAIEKGYSQWFLTLPRNNQRAAAIRRAVKTNNGIHAGLENYLPFGFWNELFHRSFYLGLWLPALHRIFLGLQNPKTRASFLFIAGNIDKAHQIRNRFAHYNLKDAGNFEFEKEVLVSLIHALDPEFLN